MSNKATDLIEKWEQETGTRATDNDSFAQAGLMGELARMMGKSNHDARDDLAAGVLIQNSAKLEKQEAAKRAQAEMFLASLGVKL